jgi:hypothetical protein
MFAVYVIYVIYYVTDKCIAAQLIYVNMMVITSIECES